MTALCRFVSFAALCLVSVVVRAEIDPLNVYMRTAYPPEAKTVSDAAEFLLEPTGYELKLDAPAPRDAQELASQPITPIARLHRTMTIIDALLVLVGTEHYLVIDREHKLISFTRAPE